jgi:tRNA 5-methylaminomethyl-2-thiouridine biosynthesis bifunctional protein
MPRAPAPADVERLPGGVLRAGAYDDTYASRAGALAETDVVFLEGCGLPQAWADRRRFVVGELGFGAGLNALALWRCWRTHRPSGAVLHLQTVEAHPLRREDAAHVLAAEPDLAPLARQLLARWPVIAFGPQRLWFEDDGFCLTVHIGDVLDGLAAFGGPVDAWFLDGFAPARNPQMWSPDVFARMAALSAPGAAAASYSAAGIVRRGLQAAGFAAERAPGYGGKRERTVARFLGPAKTLAPPLYPIPRGEPPHRIAVLGAGIAGATVAHALARRGRRAVVFDAADAPAQGASGNPAGLVAPRLDRGDGPGPAFLRAAFLAALDLYRTQTPEAFAACGVRQSAQSPREAAAFEDLAADPPWGEGRLQAPEPGVLVHGDAGVLRPAEAVRLLLSAAELRLSTTVMRLERVPGAGWRLIDAHGACIHEADAVVLASGAMAATLAQTHWLPIGVKLGQIEWGPASASPPMAVTQGAYAAPLGDDAVVFGATFDAADATLVAPGPTTEARARNMIALAALAPNLAAGVDADQLTSRTGLRATTPDRLPIMGLCPDAPAWLDQNQALANGAPPPNAPAPAHENLFVLAGLGARGLTTAPLLAEALVSEMLDEPSPLNPAMRAALHPARFLERSLRRGRKS